MTKVIVLEESLNDGLRQESLDLLTPPRHGMVGGWVHTSGPQFSTIHTVRERGGKVKEGGVEVRGSVYLRGHLSRPN